MRGLQHVHQVDHVLAARIRLALQLPFLNLAGFPIMDQHGESIVAIFGTGCVDRICYYHPRKIIFPFPSNSTLYSWEVYRAKSAGKTFNFVYPVCNLEAQRFASVILL